MRIHRGHCDSSAAKLRIDESDQPKVMNRRDLPERLSQREVYGREYDLESRCEKRHRILSKPGALREEICLSVKVGADGLFADGSGHDSGNPAGKSLGTRRLEICQRAPARGPTQLSPLDAGLVSEQVLQEKN